MNLRATLLAVAIASIGACAPNGPAAVNSDMPANAHHVDGHFRNNYPHADRQSFWKWQWERWTHGLPKIPEGGWHFPLDKPDVAWLRGNRTERTVTWIGHSTVLLQTDGVNVLTDPHFSKRASPVSFAGPKRWVAPAIALTELPRIDVVVISHNHYDHLDDDTVRALARQPGGPPHFYVPLGLARWFAERGIATTAMDWWDRREDGPLAIHLVPVQHWSARTLWDRNETLWGGFVVEAKDFRFLFVGDSGYSADFRDIGARFGDFDLAAIPIGAYEPRWFMSMQHVDPDEAVRIHRDVHARQSLGIHWGTFVLTDEPLDEPPRKLADALARHGIPRDAFWVFRHGEMRRLPARTRSRGPAQSTE